MSARREETPAFKMAIETYSKLAPHELAPDLYFYYVPSFHGPGFEHIPEHNRAPRWVSKSMLSTKNLAVPEYRSPADSQADYDEIKELVAHALDRMDR